jgi:hypothetical protein
VGFQKLAYGHGKFDKRPSMQKVDYESLKTQLDLNEQADFKYQERRHSEWTENYQLYRDRVIINRLTQRQSINVPLIKGVIKTTFSLTDEFPDIEFEEQNNDKDKEIVFNELWKDFVVKDKLEIKDAVDKKQDFLYGKTWTKFNIQNGRITTEIKEPFDMLIDRYADPSDLETADHLSEHGIFRTIDQLRANPNFDQEAVKRLQVFYGSQTGLVKAEEVTKLMTDKNERMASMGVPDVYNPTLGQTWVELKIHYQKVWDTLDEESHIHVIVLCNAGIENEILMAKPLKKTLGVDFYNFVTWSDDPERLDHYPDGVADIARTPNKFLNSYISSMAENAILRNYRMNYYDSGLENFVPQTYDPVPGGWYPIPVPQDKKLQDVFQAIETPDNTGNLEEMKYVQEIVQTAVAANAAVQGNVEDRQVTLGEVQLAVSAAKERISSIAKFYMLAQKEKGDKWAKIMLANADSLEAVTLYKKSHKGNLFKKTVSGKDYKSDAGYNCRVVSTSERQEQSIQTLQKLQAAKQQFPGNPVLDKIIGKKVLEFADVNPEEAQAVLDAQEQMMQQAIQQGIPPDAQPALPGQPVPQLTPQLNAQPA